MISDSISSSKEGGGRGNGDTKTPKRFSCTLNEEDEGLRFQEHGKKIFHIILREEVFPPLKTCYNEHPLSQINPKILNSLLFLRFREVLVGTESEHMMVFRLGGGL